MLVTKSQHHTASLHPLHSWMADDVLAALEPTVREHPDFHDGWGPIRARFAPFAREQNVRGCDLLVTDADAERLERVIAQHRTKSSAQALRRTLRQAAVLDPRTIPADVITMNSRVLCEHERTGARREVQLVYPSQARSDVSAVSILTALGACLLGRTAGAPTKTLDEDLRWRVRAVTYQPEREGHFHL